VQKLSIELKAAYKSIETSKLEIRDAQVTIQQNESELSKANAEF